MFRLLNRAILFLKTKNLTLSDYKYIGSDLDGNCYFESKDPVGSYYKRKVEYMHGHKKAFEYSESDLPVQWRSWLSQTRSDPPTQNELEIAQKTFLKIQENVKKLETDQAKKHSALPNATDFTPESWTPNLKK